MANEKKIKIQWYRSSIATPEKHKVVVRSLGLTHASGGGLAPREKFTPNLTLSSQ